MPVSVPSLSYSAAMPFAVHLRHQPRWAVAAGWLLDHTVGLFCCAPLTPWPITELVHRLIVAVPVGQVVWTHELSAAEALDVAVAVRAHDPAGAASVWAWQVACLVEDAVEAGGHREAAGLVELLATHGFDRQGDPIG